MVIFVSKKGLPTLCVNRLQRYAIFLSNYQFKINYVKRENDQADPLSRLPMKESEQTFLTNQNSLLIVM